MGAIAKAFKTAVRFVCTVALSLFFGGGVSMLSFFPEPPMGLFRVIHILACLLALFIGIMWISFSTNEEVTDPTRDNFEKRE